MAACYAGWAASAMMFCYHLAGWARNPRLQWLRWPLAAVVANRGGEHAGLAARTTGVAHRLARVEIVIIGVFVGGFVVATVRHPSTERMLVAGAALVTVAFGMRDWLVIRLSDAYGETTWVRYSSIFFGMALLLIVLRRFHAVSVQARGWVAALADRVAQRERELARHVRRARTGGARPGPHP
jgi:hypothetical protein